MGKPKFKALSSSEAEMLLDQSNLVKMQIDECLEQLDKKIIDEDKFSEWLQELKTFLKEIPETESCLMSEFSLGKSVQIPFIQIPESGGNVDFKFVPPSEVTEIGSFSLGTMCSGTPVVDVAVEIPKICFRMSDFKDQRYHRKRACYISYIAHSLLSSELVTKMKFSYQNECPYKPVLLISPKDLENITVCLTAYPSISAFQQKRFLHSKNNVRTSWFFKPKKSGMIEDDLTVATPYYNASILSDLLLPELHNFLSAEINSKNVKDGIKLLKLWCTRRGLIKGLGRLNGFILTMFVAYLMKKKKISTMMNAYEVFRCVLVGLAHESVAEKGITLSDDAESAQTLENMKSFYDVTFAEKSGTLNICYSVTKETFLMVKHEAKLAISILNSGSQDSFFQLFLDEVSFNQKFEYLLNLREPKLFKKYVVKLGCKLKLLDVGINFLAALLPKLMNILKTGLNNRVLLIDINKAPMAPWPIKSKPSNPNKGLVTLGFRLNPAVSFSNIERGPSADDPQAAQFREFWGERSEIRRFQDGTIQEAVYWPAPTIRDKRKVIHCMISDILKRHIGAEEDQFSVFGAEVDQILEIPQRVLSPDLQLYGSGEEAHVKLMQSFNSLSKQLHSLDQLALSISSVQGASPAFRFSEVYPPLPVQHVFNPRTEYLQGHISKLKKCPVVCPPYRPALKVIVSFEAGSSGKWPEDVEAIKRVKAAFHLKIAELAQSELKLTSVAFPTHTDILKDGFIFRIEVACFREISLLRQIILEDGTIGTQDSEKANSVELSTSTIPKITSSLYGLHQLHSSYGTACRLAKRWVSAQLKSGIIHDITVDLLVARLYLHPEPYTCPSLPQVAFLRFLSLLATYDWNTLPLIVNLNNQLEKEEIDKLISSFVTRLFRPPMVIITPFDRKGDLWTKKSPTKMFLRRLIILAEASLAAMDKMFSSADFDIKSMFRPPLDSFHVIIHLNRREMPRLANAVDVYDKDKLPWFKPYAYRQYETYPIVDYDPVQKYLEELRENFDEYALFFNDIYGGDFIAVLWKKSAFVPKELTISNAYGQTLHTDGKKVIPDREMILEDFKILGGSLVKNIVQL